ncbi:DUF3391 domain-containing protein [Pseudobowmanella zhangzhouensis]|uniref:DUF3391 domain-containing protein n=1 Tax=Pseudobowmanella zhangzhouensis TaxID=1537679 RepID=UPI0036224B43
MHKVSIDALQPGMVIIAISQQQGPVAIKKSGLVTSVDMVNGLREMGVTEVEIDPEQTVEIDGAPVLSPNHKLVSRQHHVQHTQSEQFNRSLFLPSIADIPSQWQEAWNETKFYALRIGSGLLVGAALAVVSQFILRGDWPNRALPITQEAEQAESQLSALSDSAQGTDEKTAVPAQTTGEQTGGPVASASETNEESPIVSSPPQRQLHSPKFRAPQLSNKLKAMTWRMRWIQSCWHASTKLSKRSVMNRRIIPCRLLLLPTRYPEWISYLPGS